MDWDKPQKPAELTENQLIQAILEGHFPIDSTLPSERELAAQLGVTRPTLREALQRLQREGWLDIQQGKPTRVRDYWREGNLSVLATLARFPNYLPDNFVRDLLFIRQLMAPTYARLAIAHHPQQIAQLMETILQIPDTAEAYALADWDVHSQLTIHSGVPIFTLILNGFQTLYPEMGKIYFQSTSARQVSRQFYQDLLTCAKESTPDKAEEITQTCMQDSLQIWQSIQPK